MKRTEDYASHREWCMIICNYLDEIYPELSEFLCGVKSNIENIDKKQSVRQIKSMCEELDWLVRDGYLTDSAMDALNARLFERFRYSLVDLSAWENEEINRILSRGKICNDKEYEMLKLKEEEIYDDNSQKDYAESLRCLLAEFETKE